MPASSPSGTGYALPAGAQNNPHAIVAAAAVKWHVPVEVLWGVYGLETDFGKLVSTSSTGALGPFQFEPGTMKTYGLTTKTVQQLGPAADAAAHLLHDNYKKTHSWNAALNMYNSGHVGAGYGIREATLKAHSSSALGDVAAWASRLSPLPATTLSSLLGSATGALPDTLPTLPSIPDPFSWTEALAKFFSTLLRPSTWWRILEFIAGLILAFMAMRQLAAAASDPGGGKILGPPVDTAAAIAGAAA